MVGISNCSCSVFEGMKSDQCVLEMNFRALFWIFCSCDIDVLDVV